MKKLLQVLLLMLFVCSGVFAQSTSPRWGSNPKKQTATGASISYRLITYSFVSGVDTLKLMPDGGETVVKIDAMTDSLLVKFDNVKMSYLGDKITFITSASSASRKLKFSTTNCTSGGTATPGSGKRVVIVFIFDGAKWVEVSRYVES